MKSQCLIKQNEICIKELKSLSGTGIQLNNFVQKKYIGNFNLM